MFEEILNASPDAVLLVDADGAIRYANASTREVIGYPPRRVDRTERRRTRARTEASGSPPAPRNLPGFALGPHDGDGP